MQVNNFRLCATDLALHWIFCTVYPHTIAAIEHAISKLDESYKVLKKSASKKSISATYWAKYSLFLQQQKNLFDIKISKEQQTLQGKLWNANPSEKEEEFYKQQRIVPRIGYCSAFVDRKWSLWNI